MNVVSIITALRSVQPRRLGRGMAFATASAFLVGHASTPAASRTVETATVARVAINGGADTSAPGVSCIRLSVPVSTTCAEGYVAIPNNNKMLVSAALANKVSGGPVWIYYEDAGPSQHCPGLI